MPVRGAFAMTASAHWLARVATGFAGLRIGYGMVEEDMELNRVPVGRLLFARSARQDWRSFFTDGVLIPAIVLEIDGTPGLGADERRKIRRGHDFGLPKLAIFAGGGTSQPGEHPHTTEGDTGTQNGGGFGDKTSAGGFEDAKYFVENGLAVSNDEEKAGDDDGIDRIGRVAEGVDIAVGEGAVSEPAASGAGFCSCDEAFGEIDAGGVDLGILLRESTGIEAGSATKVEDASAGGGPVGRKKSACDLRGVIAEKVLAAEGIEPGAAFKEAVGRVRGGMSEASAGHFAVA